MRFPPYAFMLEFARESGDALDEWFRLTAVPRGRSGPRPTVTLPLGCWSLVASRVLEVDKVNQFRLRDVYADIKAGNTVRLLNSRDEPFLFTPEQIDKVFRDWSIASTVTLIARQYGINGCR
jgi:hypothetical protein